VNVEAELARLRAEGRLSEAATLAIESYGPDVLGFLAAMLRDQITAGDAFAQACENMWKALPKFEGRSTLKTWFYTLARNAAIKLKQSPYDKLRVPLSEISEIADRVRSAGFLSSGVRSKIAEIREELDEDDRAILVLRVDRAMSWNDVARVVEGETADADITAAAARMRQRFQTIKKTIRDRALASGLLDDSIEHNA
jgi:RNA polymerase sigma-70 factor (ECF subfamily)